MICYYHGVDLDGHSSGAIVKKFNPECYCIGINYNVFDIKWDKLKIGETIYVVDFSFPLDIMQKLDRDFNLIWIDHHKTAIEEAQEAGFNPKGIREVGRGACELVWEYFNTNNAHLPDIIKHIGNFDIWNLSDPDTIPVNYGLRSRDTRPHPRNMWLWESLLDNNSIFYTRILREGRVIWEYQKCMNASLSAELAFPVELDGMKGLMANIRGVNSLFFDSLAKEDDYQFVMPFGYAGKGDIWRFSMYQINDSGIDVTPTCTRFGGGGHEGAGGFGVRRIPKELRKIIIDPKNIKERAFESIFEHQAKRIYNSSIFVQNYVKNSTEIGINGQWFRTEFNGKPVIACNGMNSNIMGMSAYNKLLTGMLQEDGSLPFVGILEFDFHVATNRMKMDKSINKDVLDVPYKQVRQKVCSINGFPLERPLINSDHGIYMQNLHEKYSDIENPSNMLPILGMYCDVSTCEPLDTRDFIPNIKFPTVEEAKEELK